MSKKPLRFKLHQTGFRGKIQENRKRYAGASEESITGDFLRVVEGGSNLQRTRVIDSIPHSVLLTNGEKVRMLTLLAQKSDQRIQGIIPNVLQKIPGAAATYALQQMLMNPHAEVRVHAIRALGKRYSTNSIPWIRTLLTDQNEGVRRIAAVVLAGLGVRGNIELKGKRHVLKTRRSMKTREGGTHVRMIGRTEFEAWKKAFKEGIPVEPLIKRNGRFHILRGPREGILRVVCGIIPDSISLAAFRLRANYRKYEKEIEEQKTDIERQLDQIGVDHGDERDTNYVIQIVRKNGRMHPKVFLVDFEEAGMFTPRTS